MATNLTPQTDFVPADELVVDDLDTLKVLADPLRLRIRELMTDPCTVKQVAEALEIQPTKLYYHINLLEKHGLIVLVDTRIVSGIIEKHYQVAALSVRVARHLLSPSSENSGEGINLTLASMLEDTKSDFIESVRDGVVKLDDEDADIHESGQWSSTRFFLTDEQAKDLMERLQALFKEFYAHSEKQRNQDDAHIYKMLLTFFPSSRRSRPDDRD